MAREAVECGKLVDDGSRCRYLKGHEKACWRYLAVTKRKNFDLEQVRKILRTTAK